MMNVSSKNDILKLLWAECPEEMMALYQEDAERRIVSNIIGADNDRPVVPGQSALLPLLHHHLHANE